MFQQAASDMESDVNRTMVTHVRMLTFEMDADDVQESDVGDIENEDDDVDGSVEDSDVDGDD